MSKRISLSSIGVGALWLAAGSLVVAEPIPPLWAAAPKAPACATAPSKTHHGTQNWAEQLSASKR